MGESGSSFSSNSPAQASTLLSSVMATVMARVSGRIRWHTRRADSCVRPPLMSSSMAEATESVSSVYWERTESGLSVKKIKMHRKMHSSAQAITVAIGSMPVARAKIKYANTQTAQTTAMMRKIEIESSRWARRSIIQPPPGC